MNKSDVIKIIKLSLGSSLAIFMSWLLSLEYAMFSGVITLLTVKNTKKETLKGALGKVYGFLLCTIFSYICFNIFGFNLHAYAIYTFIIITLCFLFKIQDVIAMCVVISSHYLLQGEVSTSLFINEFLLFIIGSSIGVVINMYIPSNLDKVYEGQTLLKREIDFILIDISDIIINPGKESEYYRNLTNLNTLIKKYTSDTYENINNNLLSDTKFFLDYIETIKKQRDILENLYDYVSNLNATPSQGYLVAEFFTNVSLHSSDESNIYSLINELDELINNMKNQPLPTTREEFENRASLFLCLIELRKFLYLDINHRSCELEFNTI